MLFPGEIAAAANDSDYNCTFFRSVVRLSVGLSVAFVHSA